MTTSHQSNPTGFSQTSPESSESAVGSAPGRVLHDLLFEDYLKLSGVSSTQLKRYRKSPLHGLNVKFKDSPAMQLGRAAHTAILEPENFLRHYALYDGKRDKRTKAYQKFLEANPGKQVLKPEEYQQVLDMAEAVRSDREAHALLTQLNRQTEVSIQWTHPRTGELCKSRLDLICSAVVDIKTTRSVDPGRFASDAERLGYYMQAAFYADALAAATGQILPFVFIAVEKEYPYDVAVYDVPERYLTDGRFLYDAALDLKIETELAASKAQALGRKYRPPGVTGGERLELHRPAWAVADDEGQAYDQLIIPQEATQ